MLSSVYSVWESTPGGVNLTAVVTDEGPPAGTLVDRMPAGAPPIGQRIVFCMANGLPEEICDDLARAYIATMEARADELGCGFDAAGVGESPVLSLAALALKHSSLRWPKKKRNADLRTNGYDPDGADGKIHRMIVNALINRP